MNLKKTLILLLAVVVLIIGILVIARSISNKEAKTSAPVQTTDKANSQTEEIQVSDVKSILRGEITAVDMQSLTLVDTNKNEVKLNIPKKDVQFFKETKLNDNSTTLKEIGLFELKAKDKVEVKYNPENSNLNFVKVLGE